MPTLTKALGQWQLPLADGVRVRTHVPGVWGSIPSQVDPITLAPNPHSNAISQRQLPLAKGFGQCRHSCYRQTQVLCCRLVVGSTTYTPPRNGTRPRVLIMVTCTWTKGRFSDLSNVPATR